MNTPALQPEDFSAMFPGIAWPDPFGKSDLVRLFIPSGYCMPDQYFSSLLQVLNTSAPAYAFSSEWPNIGIHEVSLSSADQFIDSIESIDSGEFRYLNFMVMDATRSWRLYMSSNDAGAAALSKEQFRLFCERFGGMAALKAVREEYLTFVGPALPPDVVAFTRNSY